MSPQRPSSRWTDPRKTSAVGMYNLMAYKPHPPGCPTLSYHP